MDYFDAEKIECSEINDFDKIIDRFDSDEVFQNDYWEGNGYLCHLLAIVVMTITILLFI